MQMLLRLLEMEVKQALATKAEEYELAELLEDNIAQVTAV
jgi:hypothetical protein